MDAAFAEQKGVKMKSEELCIPAYLNQSIVFDMLAIIEDGFSNVKTIKSSDTKESTDNLGVEASADTALGLKNIFSLLSIGIKGKYDHTSGKTSETEAAFEKVHTPTSLFWKLRDYLVNNSLIRNIETVTAESDIKVGEFIEFEAVFHQNPIIESIENIQKLIDLMVIISPESLQTSQTANPGGGKTPKYSPAKKPPIVAQVEAFSNALSLDDSIDLLASNTNETHMVVTCDKNYFIHGNANRVIDGKYKVLGKVVNFMKTTEESISLLRTSSFSRFKKSFIKEMFSGFTSMESAGFDLPELLTEIFGPCIQIIPIGIYI